ncbi:hypothetical protein [Georgenia alba]|uniref:Uncharacterized protein n=1 Tax=Georgenia alba TaxID=2233858 RepID=A0ABW2QG69_9MICO
MAQGERLALTRRRASWFLLLTVPLAGVASFYLLVVTTIAWCGISGCSGGGYGLVSDPDEVLATLASVFAGLLWFAALAIPPWLRPARSRLLLAALVGVALAVVVLLWGTAGFARA